MSASENERRLSTTLKLAMIASEADVAVLHLNPEGLDSYRQSYWVGLFLHDPFPFGVSRVAEYALKTGKAYFVSDVKADPLLADLRGPRVPLEVRENISSCIACPTPIDPGGRGDRGVLFLGWRRRVQQFSQNQHLVVDYVVDLLASELRNLNGRMDWGNENAVLAHEGGRVTLEFSLDIEPRTLQDLSREVSLWVSLFESLGSIQGADSLVPLLGIRRGSLILAVTAAMPIVFALAAVYGAVLARRKNRREEEQHEVEMSLKRLQIEKLLGEIKATRSDSEAQRTIAQVMGFLDRFMQLGGRVLFEVSSELLNAQPELRRQLETIATIETERMKG